MELLLWRHAEAAPGDPDAARPLTDHGRRQAAVMARFLAPRLPADLRLLVSPARRTQETAAALGRPVETVEAIAPGGNVSALLAAAGWPDAVQSVLVVGHQPTLGDAVARLVDGSRAGSAIGTAGMCWLASRPRKGRGEARVLASIEVEILLRSP